MAEDLTVPAGLTDYLVILWTNTLLDYRASFPLDFQALADIYNGKPAGLFAPVSRIEAAQIKSKADCVTEELRNRRIYWNLLEKIETFQPSLFQSPIAGKLHILTDHGISRIKKYISEGTLPKKTSLLNDCKHLEELRKTFREMTVTDTIAAIVTPFSDDEIGENFPLPKFPPADPLAKCCINILCVTIVTKDCFLKYCGGLNSYLARDVARELRTPKKKSFMLSMIEQNLESYLAPYLEWGPPAAGITPTPAPDAADATAEAAPVKRRRLPAGFKMIKQGRKPMTDEHKDLFFRKVLKHVVNIGHNTADGKKWKYADKGKTGTNQTRDHESFIFEYNGTRYRVFCYIDKKPEFCVKRQDRTGQGQPHYFHFIG